MQPLKAINHNSSATPNVFPPLVQELWHAHVELLEGFGCDASIRQRPLVQIGDCSWGYRILVRVGVESFQESQYGLFVVLVQFRVIFWLRWSDTHSSRCSFFILLV